MTSSRLSIPITWALTVLLCGLAAAQHEDGATTIPVNGDRLGEIIRRAEAEGARYLRLETVVRHASGFAKNTKDEAKWRAIVQDDLFWLRNEETSTFASGEKRVDVSLSAFDGRTTRNIDDRKCVNIRPGRCQPWQIAAPHAWAMYGFPMRLPLSVYLKGGGAIKSYRQSQRPPQRADPSGFARVEATAEPDETIDGLDCAKIRLRRWFYGDDHPFIEIVWLAKERNYLPIHAEWYDWRRDTKLPQSIALVDDLREVAPGLWFPFHAVHRHFIMDVDGRIFIARSHESYVTSLDLSPAAPASLYQVNVPAGTLVNVFSEQGRRIGQFRQDVGGPSFISDEQWQTMLTAERSKGNTAQAKQ